MGSHGVDRLEDRLHGRNPAEVGTSGRKGIRADIFDFIELFYNSQRRHSHVGGVSPRQFEADYFARLQGV